MAEADLGKQLSERIGDMSLKDNSNNELVNNIVESTLSDTGPSSPDEDGSKREGSSGRERKESSSSKQDPSVVVREGMSRSDLDSLPIETVGSLNGWAARRVSVTGQVFFEQERDGSIKTDRAPEAFAVTPQTKRSDLNNLPLEDVGSLVGWTARRVSVTGQVFFERESDGRIQIDRPKEAIEAVKRAEEEDSDSDSDYEVPKPIIVADQQQRKRPSETSKPLEPVTVKTTTPEKPAPIPPETLKQIQSVEGNKRCADCGASGPTWASVSFGVLLCVNCSGNHRSFGTHISVVKSLTLDNWTSEQISYIYPHGGNAKFKQAIKVEGKQSARYKTEEAAMYRTRLRALVKGEPVPDRLDPLDADRPGSSASAVGLPPPSPHARSTTSRTFQSIQSESGKDATFCQLCGKPFSVVVRKHFCRNCDRAVCSRCAPAANSKPLPHLGLGMTPLRHCSKCYRSPFIDWSSVGLSAAERVAEAAVAAEGPSVGTLARRKTLTRRKTVSESKKQRQPERRKTLGQTIAGLMKRG